MEFAIGLSLVAADQGIKPPIGQVFLTDADSKIFTDAGGTFYTLPRELPPPSGPN